MADQTPRHVLVIASQCRAMGPPIPRLPRINQSPAEARAEAASARAGESEAAEDTSERDLPERLLELLVAPDVGGGTAVDVAGLGEPGWPPGLLVNPDRDDAAAAVRLALRAAAASGGVLLLHYAGHGTRAWVGDEPVGRHLLQLVDTAGRPGAQEEDRALDLHDLLDEELDGVHQAGAGLTGLLLSLDCCQAAAGVAQASALYTGGPGAPSRDHLRLAWIGSSQASESAYDAAFTALLHDVLATGVTPAGDGAGSLLARIRVEDVALIAERRQDFQRPQCTGLHLHDPALSYGRNVANDELARVHHLTGGEVRHLAAMDAAIDDTDLDAVWRSLAEARLVVVEGGPGAPLTALVRRLRTELPAHGVPRVRALGLASLHLAAEDVAEALHRQLQGWGVVAEAIEEGRVEAAPRNTAALVARVVGVLRAVTAPLTLVLDGWSDWAETGASRAMEDFLRAVAEDDLAHVRVVVTTRSGASRGELPPPAVVLPERPASEGAALQALGDEQEGTGLEVLSAILDVLAALPTPGAVLPLDLLLDGVTRRVGHAEAAARHVDRLLGDARLEAFVARRDDRRGVSFVGRRDDAVLAQFRALWGDREVSAGAADGHRLLLAECLEALSSTTNDAGTAYARAMGPRHVLQVDPAQLLPYFARSASPRAIDEVARLESWLGPTTEIAPVLRTGLQLRIATRARAAGALATAVRHLEPLVPSHLRDPGAATGGAAIDEVTALAAYFLALTLGDAVAVSRLVGAADVPRDDVRPVASIALLDVVDRRCPPSMPWLAWLARFERLRLRGAELSKEAILTRAEELRGDLATLVLPDDDFRLSVRSGEAGLFELIAEARVGVAEDLDDAAEAAGWWVRAVAVASTLGADRFEVLRGTYGLLRTQAMLGLHDAAIGGLTELAERIAQLQDQKHVLRAQCLGLLQDLLASRVARDARPDDRDRLLAVLQHLVAIAPTAEVVAEATWWRLVAAVETAAHPEDVTLLTEVAAFWAARPGMDRSTATGLDRLRVEVAAVVERWPDLDGTEADLGAVAADLTDDALVHASHVLGHVLPLARGLVDEMPGTDSRTV